MITTPSIFLEIRVTSSQIEQAKDIRKKRDALYGNHFLEKGTDLRWIGDLAEIVFDEYLDKEGYDYHWHNDLKASNKPDFTINGITMDLKCLKRAMPMTEKHLHYTFGVTANQLKMNVDVYGFVNFVESQGLMQFIGCITKTRFLKESSDVKSGQQVHHAYQIRKNHQLLNIEASKLTSFSESLAKISVFEHQKAS